MIDFRVKGRPKGQGRPRAFIRGKHAGVYNPKVADDWKALIAIEAKKYCPKTPMAGPVRVDIDFFLPRPKRLCRKKDPDHQLWCEGKPDRDNLDKAVLDVLTDIGFWRDDSQVCCGLIQKFYHGKEGFSGAIIKIAEADPYYKGGP